MIEPRFFKPLAIALLLYGQSTFGTLNQVNAEGFRTQLADASPPKRPGENASRERSVPGDRTPSDRPLPGTTGGTSRPLLGTTSGRHDKDQTPGSAARRKPEEEWQKQREAMRAEIKGNITLSRDANDELTAKYKTDKSVFMYFKKSPDSVDITQIETSTLGAGAGSLFAAESIKQSGMIPENKIRLQNIIEPTTTQQIRDGVPINETKLASFVISLAHDLGRDVKNIALERQISDYGTPTNRQDIIIYLKDLK